MPIDAKSPSHSLSRDWQPEVSFVSMKKLFDTIPS
jgi:hypothetical protein